MIWLGFLVPAAGCYSSSSTKRVSTAKSELSVTKVHDNSVIPKANVSSIASSSDSKIASFVSRGVACSLGSGSTGEIIATPIECCLLA